MYIKCFINNFHLVQYKNVERNYESSKHVNGNSQIDLIIPILLLKGVNSKMTKIIFSGFLKM